MAADTLSWLTVGETYDCAEVNGVMMVRINNRPLMAMEKEHFEECFEVSNEGCYDIAAYKDGEGVTIKK